MWIKGQSGNLKGRPKRVGRTEIKEAFRRENLDIVTEFVRNYKEIDNPSIKCAYLLKLMEFVYAKPKDKDTSLEEAVEIIKDAIRESNIDSGTSESHKLLSENSEATIQS